MNCIQVISKPSLILSKQGLLPPLHKQKLWILKTTLHSMIYTLMLGLFIANLINGIRMKKPIFTNRMISFTMTGVNLLAKFFGIHKNAKHYLSVLQNLKSNIFNIRNTHLNKHIQLVGKISRVLLRYFAITIGAVVFTASVLPIVIKADPLIPCPIDIGKYMILYNILHLPLILYFAINSTCLDVVLMSFLGICIAQLNILEERLINLEDSKRSTITKTPSKVATILEECVTLHKMIIQYVENINVVLSLPLFIQYSSGCFVLCNSILQVAITEDNTTADVITILGYTCINFTQLAAYHWLGNEIMYKSNTVIDACYLSKWYTLDQKSQKYILLLMERAKRPLIIKLYTIVYISLESLTVVIRWSYSLFALLKATYK